MRCLKTLVTDSKNNSYTTTIITTRAEFFSLAPEWHSLLINSAANSIFLTFEWLATWLDTVYPQAELFIITVRDKDNKLVAAAPFYIGQFKLFKLITYRYLRFIGDCHAGAEYPDIIVLPGLEESSLPAIKEALFNNRKWDCLWLPNLAGWTGSRQRFDKCFSGNLSFARKRPATFSSLLLPGTYNDFLQSLTKSRRNIFLRQERKLHKNHDIRFEICQHPGEIDDFLNNLFRLHELRWQSLGQQGSFARRPLMVDFYRKFAPLALKKAWLGLFMLKVDDQIQAAQYGYVYNEVFYQLQEGFNPQGPAGFGNTLRLNVMKWCINCGIKEYDFLGDHTPHKKYWGSQERLGDYLFLGRSCLKNKLPALLKMWPTGRFIDQGPPANLGKGH